MFINSIQPFKIKIDEVHTLEYKPSNERVYLHDNEGREAVFSRSDAERLYWLNTRLEKIEIKTSKHNNKFILLKIVGGASLVSFNPEVIGKASLLELPVDVVLLVRVHLKDDNIEQKNQSLTNFILSCINLEVEEVMTEEMQ